jgi:hypothetical protein
MTLEFYAGALIAIDSAKTLGLPIVLKYMIHKKLKIHRNCLDCIKQ